MQKELVEHLKNSGILQTLRIIKAFQKIDRADFVRGDFRSVAYGDYPLPIGAGQTISQPTTVAFMLELLQPKTSDKILDLGSGSGWTTALLAQIIERSGKIIGVEIVPELAKFGQKNLAKYGFKNARISKAGAELGWTSEAPFDKILVSAAADKLPQDLVDQLKVGGRLVIPIGNSIFKFDRLSKNKIAEREFPGFVFVPLTRD